MNKRAKRKKLATISSSSRPMSQSPPQRLSLASTQAGSPHTPTDGYTTNSMHNSNMMAVPETPPRGLVVSPTVTLNADSPSSGLKLLSHLASPRLREMKRQRAAGEEAAAAAVAASTPAGAAVQAAVAAATAAAAAIAAAPPAARAAAKAAAEAAVRASAQAAAAAAVAAVRASSAGSDPANTPLPLSATAGNVKVKADATAQYMRHQQYQMEQAQRQQQHHQPYQKASIDTARMAVDATPYAAFERGPVPTAVRRLSSNTTPSPPPPTLNKASTKPRSGARSAAASAAAKASKTKSAGAAAASRYPTATTSAASATTYANGASKRSSTGSSSTARAAAPATTYANGVPKPKRERSTNTGTNSSAKGGAGAKGKPKAKVAKGGKAKQGTGSRKDKSLGLLSERFLSMYADGTNQDICLDIVAQQLSVERRRIYDIVNVLEGLELICRKVTFSLFFSSFFLFSFFFFKHVPPNFYTFCALLPPHYWGLPTCAVFSFKSARSLLTDGFLFFVNLSLVRSTNEKAKNCYEWLGYGDLPKTLTKFKELAPTQVAPSGGALPVGALGTSGCKPVYNETTGARVGFAPRTSAQRQERSLGILAQRFVMLLLSEEGKLVTLEDAVVRLTCPGIENTATKNKTRVRRLYDIGNVLCSLKLIEKDTIRVEGARKPAFKWNGIDPAVHTAVTTGAAAACATTASDDAAGSMAAIAATASATDSPPPPTLMAPASSDVPALAAGRRRTSSSSSSSASLSSSTSSASVNINPDGSDGSQLPLQPISPSDASSAADSPLSAEEEEIQLPARKRLRKQSLVKSMDSLDNAGSLATGAMSDASLLRATLPAADLTASQQAYTVKLGHGNASMDWLSQTPQQALAYRPAPGPSDYHAAGQYGAAGALLFAASAINATTRA